MELSRTESLLQSVIDGTQPQVEPQSRAEQYLHALITKTDPPSEPKSRIEEYYQALCKKGLGDDTNPLEEFIKIRGLRYLFCVFISADANIRNYIDNINDLLVFFLKNVSLTGFEDAKGMFYKCTKLTEVPLFDTSTFTETTEMFLCCDNLVKVPLFDTKNVKKFSSMFYGCKKLSEVPMFDFSSAESIYYMFYGCESLKTLPLFDFSSATKLADATYAFSCCYNLEIVPELDFRKIVNAGGVFKACKALKECWIKNISCQLQVGSGTTYGHLLTLESLLHLIGELVKQNYTKTFTIGTANLEKISSLYVKLIPITDEMRAEDDLIDKKIPFVVCESTDEGAMTISEYAAGKKWVIK